MIDKLHKHLKEVYKPALGKSRNEVITPALLLDLDVAKKNIQFMAGRMKNMPAELRPHIKVQKCPELAKMQGVCERPLPPRERAPSRAERQSGLWRARP